MMDMPPVSDFLKAKLTREGKHEAKRQLDRVEMDAGCAQGGEAHPATAHRGGGTGADLETRMRKTARYTKNGAALLMLVVDNDQ